MSDRTVVVVDPFSSGNLIAPALARWSIRTIAVLSPGAPPPVYADTFRPSDFAAVYEQTGTLDELVACLEEERAGNIRIFAGAETGVDLADQLAEILTPRFANAPEHRIARRDKGAMGACVHAAGLPAARQFKTDDIQALSDWMKAEQLCDSPVVVKPTSSVGTDGVTLANGLEGAIAATRDLLGRTNRIGYRNRSVVVQAYLRGTEYVVDSYSHAGVHAVLSVCRYRKTQIDGMPLYDRMDFLKPSDPEITSVVDYALGVLDALGIRNGPGHCEVMLTAEGPRMIECGARMHGGGHSIYCRQATGDSQLDRIVSACREVAHEPAEATDPAAFTPTTVKFLTALRTGVLTDAAPLDQIRDLPSLFAARGLPATGDQVNRTVDLFSAIGFVVLSHRDATQVEADLAAIEAVERALDIAEPRVEARA